MLWNRIQSNLLDGEGERNAYWQMHVAQSNTIHLSWVWRESSDVTTNHDMHSARSDDDGESWQTSSGEYYQLPITQQSAEIVWRIGENSNLINQTSMTSDIGYRISDIGYRISDIGYRISDIGYRRYALYRYILSRRAVGCDTNSCHLSNRRYQH